MKMRKYLCACLITMFVFANAKNGEPITLDIQTYNNLENGITKTNVSNLFEYDWRYSKNAINSFGNNVLDCNVTYFTNQTVTSNTYITDCDIYVQNVTVQNNANLTLDATNETIIDSSFDMTLGSTLNVE
jgi:hypothetical protein